MVVDYVESIANRRGGERVANQQLDEAAQLRDRCRREGVPIGQGAQPLLGPSLDGATVGHRE
jgi:hypothetical protein